MDKEDAKKKEYEQMKERKEREARKAILVHEIAKQTVEATNTYAEAFEVLELVERQLTTAMRYKHKPTALDYPTDKYNQIVEPPSEQTPGGHN